MAEYEDLYKQIEEAAYLQKTSEFKFANDVSEPFFFKLLEEFGETYLFGEKKYKGVDGLFLAPRRPFFIDVKFDAGVSARYPQNNGKNLFAEITNNAMPSAWLGAYHLKGGIGMINWHRQEAFLYDPNSVQKIFELWYQKKLKAVGAGTGSVGILVPCEGATDIGRTEAQVIFSICPTGYKRIK